MSSRKKCPSFFFVFVIFLWGNLGQSSLCLLPYYGQAKWKRYQGRIIKLRRTDCVWLDTKKLLWASISSFAFWLICHQHAARVSKFSTLQLNIASGCAHKNQQTKNESIKVQRRSLSFFFVCSFVCFWRRRIIFQISSQFCRLPRQAGWSGLRNAGAWFTIMAPTPMRWYWFNSEQDSQ